MNFLQRTGTMLVLAFTSANAYATQFPTIIETLPAQTLIVTPQIAPIVNAGPVVQTDSVLPVIPTDTIARTREVLAATPLMLDVNAVLEDFLGEDAWLATSTGNLELDAKLFVAELVRYRASLIPEDLEQRKFVDLTDKKKKNRFSVEMLKQAALVEQDPYLRNLHAIYQTVARSKVSGTMRRKEDFFSKVEANLTILAQSADGRLGDKLSHYLFSVFDPKLRPRLNWKNMPEVVERLADAFENYLEWLADPNEQHFTACLGKNIRPVTFNDPYFVGSSLKIKNSDRYWWKTAVTTIYSRSYRGDPDRTKINAMIFALNLELSTREISTALLPKTSESTELGYLFVPKLSSEPPLDWEHGHDRIADKIFHNFKGFLRSYQELQAKGVKIEFHFGYYYKIDAEIKRDNPWIKEMRYIYKSQLRYFQNISSNYSSSVAMRLERERLINDVIDRANLKAQNDPEVKELTDKLQAILPLAPGRFIPRYIMKADRDDPADLARKIMHIYKQRLELIKQGEKNVLTFSEIVRLDHRYYNLLPQWQCALTNVYIDANRLEREEQNGLATLNEAIDLLNQMIMEDPTLWIDGNPEQVELPAKLKMNVD